MRLQFLKICQKLLNICESLASFIYRIEVNDNLWYMGSIKEEIVTLGT